MNPIEKAARALCQANGETQEDAPGDAPHWTACIPQVMAVIDALREPSPSMTEAGSEIIRHVGGEESDTGYQSDAANAWRFMIDALHQDAAHLQAHS